MGEPEIRVRTVTRSIIGFSVHFSIPLTKNLQSASAWWLADRRWWQWAVGSWFPLFFWGSLVYTWEGERGKTETRYSQGGVSCTSTQTQEKSVPAGGYQKGVVDGVAAICLPLWFPAMFQWTIKKKKKKSVQVTRPELMKDTTWWTSHYIFSLSFFGQLTVDQRLWSFVAVTWWLHRGALVGHKETRVNLPTLQRK